MGLYAEFVLSAASPNQFPGDHLPEIALVGRSNVGKSSMINSLLGTPKLARTSSTPGRTQTLNFYRIWPQGRPVLKEQAGDAASSRFTLTGRALEAAQQTGAFYFVDMPGYGYAKVSESQRKAWQKLIENYLIARENLKAVIQIVDLRHPPSRDDIAMWDWLRYQQRVRLCLATKADKLSRAQRAAAVNEVVRGLGMDRLLALGPEVPASPDLEPLLVYSAEDGTGRAQLWPWIVNLATE